MKNAEIFFQGRNMIVCAFEENIVPLPKEEFYQHQEWTKKETEQEHILREKDKKLLLKKRA